MNATATYNGNRMAAIGSGWQRTLTRAGIEQFHFHNLRHTSAMLAHDERNQFARANGTGWLEVVAMVLRYTHLAPEHLAETANDSKSAGSL